MKIQVLSDLHLESRAFTLKVNPLADAVVIAGDIAAPSARGRMVQMLERASAIKPVMIIPGNHEYYNTSFAEHMTWMAGLQDSLPNVIDLGQRSKRFGDVLFVGATLWTNFSLPFWKDGKKDSRPELAKRIAHVGISDFGRIKHFTPEDAELLYASELMYLQGMVAANPNDKVVVVTHFLPHENSVDSLYATSMLNPYFATDIGWLMRENACLKLWIHGHTHHSCDYTHGHARVVCNPRGYTEAENPEFQSQFLVEV